MITKSKTVLPSDSSIYLSSHLTPVHSSSSDFQLSSPSNFESFSSPIITPTISSTFGSESSSYLSSPQNSIDISSYSIRSSLNIDDLQTSSEDTFLSTPSIDSSFFTNSISSFTIPHSTPPVPFSSPIINSNINSLSDFNQFSSIDNSDNQIINSTTQFNFIYSTTTDLPQSTAYFNNTDELNNTTPIPNNNSNATFLPNNDNLPYFFKTGNYF